MGIRNKQNIYLVTALFLGAVFVLGVLHGCKRQKPEAAGPGTVTPVAGTQGGAPSAVDTAANLFREQKASIQNIVNAAKDRWSPKFEGWWGKLAPDFALTDLDGQTHKPQQNQWMNLHEYFPSMAPGMGEARQPADPG